MAGKNKKKKMSKRSRNIVRRGGKYVYEDTGEEVEKSKKVRHGSYRGITPDYKKALEEAAEY